MLKHSLVLRLCIKTQQCCASLTNLPGPVTGEVLADPLLVVPQQAVEGQHIAVTDKGQTVVDRVAGRRVRRYVQEKPVVERGENTLKPQIEDAPHEARHCFKHTLWGLCAPVEL